MSQTWDVDQIIAASTGYSTDIVRIVDAFNALRSCFSGATEPVAGDRVAYMLWHDTTLNVLKQRNSANTGWNILDPNVQVAYLATGGTSTAYTLTPTIPHTAYTLSTRIRVQMTLAPGASPTINVSGLGAKNFKYYDITGTKQFITSTVAPAGWVSDCIYDGTDIVMLTTASR